MANTSNDVLFEFFGADGLEQARGKVIWRDGEMALEVDCPGDRPYSIRGIPHRDFLRGRHQDQPNDVAVEAKWVCLDDLYIGIWIEDRREYLFRFRLPD